MATLPADLGPKVNPTALQKGKEYYLHEHLPDTYKKVILQDVITNTDQSIKVFLKNDTGGDIYSVTVLSGFWEESPFRTFYEINQKPTQKANSGIVVSAGGGSASAGGGFASNTKLYPALPVTKKRRNRKTRSNRKNRSTRKH